MESKTLTLRPSAQGCRPRYAIRHGLGFWELIFARQPAAFKHEQGAFYVAYLLLNPPAEPIHGLALSLKIASLYSKYSGATEIADPATGQLLTVPSDATLQQRNLLVDDARAVAAIRRKQLELEAILDDEDQIEPVKAEAQRELVAIYDYQKRNPTQTRDVAQRAVQAVSRAVKRLHHHLAQSLDTNGRPHPVLRPFADHLHKYLLIPSGRYAGAGRARVQTGVAGCFTYEPPKGVTWKI